MTQRFKTLNKQYSTFNFHRGHYLARQKRIRRHRPFGICGLI
jgi:hypothetical protein